MVSHDIKLRQTQMVHTYHLWLQMSDVTTYLLLRDEGDQLNIKGDAPDRSGGLLPLFLFALELNNQRQKMHSKKRTKNSHLLKLKGECHTIC